MQPFLLASSAACTAFSFQAWNHNFFWAALKPAEKLKGSREEAPALPGQVQELLERDFGSYDAFVQQFRDCARSHFGSGYVWLSGTRLGITERCIVESTAAALL